MLVQKMTWRDVAGVPYVAPRAKVLPGREEGDVDGNFAESFKLYVV